MGLITALALYAASTSCITVASADELQQKANPEAERLIDALVDARDIDREHYVKDFHRIARYSSTFLPIEHEPSLIERQMLAHPQQPPPNPTMRRLVEMGLRALPSLIAHLTDARETRLVSTNDTWGFFFSSGYDARYEDPTKKPPGTAPVYEGSYKETHGPYTVLVGDLCYVAIGQIVNRSYNALGGLPGSGVGVIHSPVHTPALAAAVNSDWGGLTPAQHRDQLISDAIDPRRGSWTAMTRLMYYYPVEGERLALQMIERDYYDDLRGRSRLGRVFYGATTLKEMRERFSKASKLFDQEFSAMVPFIIHDTYANSLTSTESIDKELVSKFLRDRFPNYDPYERKLFAVTSIEDQASLIHALHSFESFKLDKATQDAFRRSMQFPVTDENVEMYKDELAIVCMERLIGKGSDDEYREFLDKKIAKLTRELEPDETGFMLGEFVNLRQRIAS